MAPPPLPKDAFQKPPAAARPQPQGLNRPWPPKAVAPSPFDDEVTGRGPAPTPTASGDGTTWLGRTILHPSHHEELEQNAAVNEFGLKMPRKEAEAAAYADYEKRQRTQAAAHHLAGMKAAHAAGDMEAARKHGMMYQLHVKALGHEPVGPTAPAIAALLQGQKVYRFKPHKGDTFAVQAREKKGDGIEPAPPPHTTDGVENAPNPPRIGKAEALHALYKVVEPLAKADPRGKCSSCGKTKSKTKLTLIAGRDRCTDCVDKAHEKAKVFERPYDKPEPIKKGEVAGEIHGATTKKPKRAGYDDVNTARAVKWARSSGEQTHCTTCKQPAEVNLRGVCRGCVYEKAELALTGKPPRKAGPRPCVCDAYHHPHRTGGGKCAKPKGR